MYNLLFDTSHLPIKCNRICKTFIFHISIQNIVANICDSALHPFDIHLAFPGVKVVRQKLAIWRAFPVEIFRDFFPETCWIFYRFLVPLIVLIHAVHMSYGLHLVCRMKPSHQLLFMLCRMRRHVETMNEVLSTWAERRGTQGVPVDNFLYLGRVGRVGYLGISYDSYFGHLH